MTAFSLDGVSFRYRDGDAPALRDVSLQVDEGSFVGVTGPADAGKTTLCRLLPGFVPHFFSGDLTGSVSVGDVDVPAASIAALGETVGYVFENPVDQLTGAATTVLEEVAFGLEQRGVPADTIRVRAMDELARVGVSDLAEREPNSLSGGQLQRVAVASVLALDPRLLVLDEPTAELDPDGTDAVFDVASRLHREGYTVVVVSQDLQRLAPRADRLLVVDGGVVVRDGSPADVLADRSIDDHVRVPPTVRLGRALRDEGLVPADRSLPLTVAAAVDELRTHTDLDPDPDPGVGSGKETTRAPTDGGGAVGTTDESALVRLDDVHHRYETSRREGGVEALRGVDLTLDDGCVALVGPNGAGKTTLVKHLNGLLTPTTGRVLVDGVNTRETQVSTLAADVGLVFQNPDDQLFHPRVADEVRFGPENVGVADIDANVDRALERVGLADQGTADTYELGRAARKRVALASVLAMEPRTVVLDEPTAGQDAAGVDVVADVVSTLVADGRLVIVVTHDVSFVTEHADRVVVLSGGRVLADGPPRTVFSDESVTATSGVQAPVPTQVSAALGIGGVVTVDDLLARLR